MTVGGRSGSLGLGSKGWGGRGGKVGGKVGYDLSD